jgi:branched-chain amino acid transport system ATP-binding protein
VLELQDLHSFYGRSHVVQGVSLRVGAGEAVGLVGRNGVGKTTTLKSIMGLVPRVRGRVMFKDMDLRSTSAHSRARRGLGFVPDERAVFPHMTVEENIRIGAFLQAPGEQSRCLATAYELFPILAERRHQQAGTLSGGQQKMLSLARGLALKPDLLLVDEPSEGLMPINVELIAKALAGAATAGTSVLVVDASFDLLKTVCGRLYVMEQGTITAEHPLSDFDNPADLVRTYLRGAQAGAEAGAGPDPVLLPAGGESPET